jgi:hypothetical protein
MVAAAVLALGATSSSAVVYENLGARRVPRPRGQALAGNGRLGAGCILGLALDGGDECRAAKAGGSSNVLAVFRGLGRSLDTTDTVC